MVRFYISEFTCFVSFPPTSVAFLGTFHANPVAIVALGFGGAVGKWGAKTIGLGGAKMYCDLLAHFF